MRLGMLIGGYLLELMGVRAVLLGVAACYLVATAGMIFHPTLREMNAHDDKGMRQPGYQISPSRRS